MQTSGNKRLRILKGLGLLLIAWLAVVILFSIQLNIISGFPVTQALRLAVPLWLIWLALAPATIFIALRFPFGKGRNVIHAAILIMVCFVFVMISQALTRNVMNHRSGIMVPSGPPPWIRLAMEEEASSNSSEPRRQTKPGPRMGLPLNISAARSTFDVLIFWTLVSACQAYVWIRRARDQEQQALKAEASANQAQLQALQSQLNPHFLFNSLNAITTLIHTNPSVADEMLTDLSRLLRATLDSETRQTIPLSEELQLLDCYLEIEGTRFGDRLNIIRELDPSALDVPVPTFILQPLVENAVRHGIERCSSDGTIQLITSRQPDRLIITIKDSGPGLEIHENDQTSSGIGISNTRQRLMRLYGESANLSITNIETGGCQVTLDLPLETHHNSKPTHV